MTELDYHQAVMELYQRAEKMEKRLAAQSDRLHQGDTHFATIELTMKSINEKQDIVIGQTTKTNGRVTRLEKWRVWVIGLSVGLGITQGPEIASAIVGVIIR